MIGVSIRRLRNNKYADRELYYQCPHCGHDQYFQKFPAYLCSMCSRVIDPAERLYLDEGIINKLTYHLGGAHESYMKYYPFPKENKIEIKWSEDD
jgi:DNA-directed RNA polymerase subunit RPC12/RpoP